MTDYFHLSSALLAPGSIIEPGNWGRIIRAAGWQHSLALRETALELGRLAKFPNAPSRLECAFVFLTMNEAIDFRNAGTGFAMHCLYRVRLNDPTAASFVTGWGLVAPQGTISEWPDIYWRGVATSIPGVDGSDMAVGVSQRREMLTLSQLVIEERLN